MLGRKPISESETETEDTYLINCRKMKKGDKKKDGMESSEIKDMDYIFTNLVGGCGRWQWFITIALFPTLWVGGYSLFITIFSAYEPEFRCYVDACDSSDSSVEEPWTSFALPKKENNVDLFHQKTKVDSCFKYAPLVNDSQSCSADSFNTSEKLNCDKYVWDRSQMKSTLTTELNLVCGEEYQRRLLSTFLMVGLLLGSYIGGRIGDQFGRKKSLFLSAALTVPVVIAGGFVNNYIVYLVLRLINCTLLPILWINGHTYSLEYLSPSYRKLIVCIKDIPVSYFIYALLVHLTRHWTYLHLWTGIISIIGLPIYFWVPESPRWLAGNNKKDEAEKIFLDIAKANGKDLSKEEIKEIQDILSKVDRDTEPSLNPSHLFAKKHIIKSFILLLNWVTVCLGFYALTLNATKLSGDAVWNMFLSAVADSPTSIILYFTLDSIGRRYCLMASQFLLGTACLVLAFIPKGPDYSMAVLITYLFGKMSSGMGFVLIYLITAELYPTNLRAQAVGFCSMIARVFSLGANFVPILSVLWEPLPMVVLGVPTLLACFASYFLQETAGRELPQSMKEAEAGDLDAEKDQTSAYADGDVPMYGMEITHQYHHRNNGHNNKDSASSNGLQNQAFQK